jgi:hypothetical protein
MQNTIRLENCADRQSTYQSLISNFLAMSSANGFVVFLFACKRAHFDSNVSLVLSGVLLTVFWLYVVRMVGVCCGGDCGVANIDALY